MRLGELFPTAPNEAHDLEIKGITSDSRQVKDGYVFAALSGVKFDGRQFIPQAIEQGAVAVLATGDPVDGTVFIASDEPRRDLALASARFYPAQPSEMVAITGTNGKSSTVDFLRQIWERAGLKAASMGTLGAVGPKGAIDLGHTTPDPVAIHDTLNALATDSVTHCAMEASSHGLVQYRLDGVELTAVAFTNLTQDHLDYHPTFEDYRAAKLRLFSELAPKDSPAIINADSKEFEVFKKAALDAGLHPLSVGWRGEYLKLRELTPRATGQMLDLIHEGQEVELELPLIGEFQALNALTAAALAIATGTPAAIVFDALRGLKTVKGRMELVGETRDGAPVFVDYAHTPDGLDVLLRAARPHTAGRLICIFGCGGDRDTGKRPMMGKIAHSLADEVIVTDDNPRSEDPSSVRAAILAAAPGATEIADRGDAIREGVRRLKAGDTLLIAGKGHETGQTIGSTVIPFSDQDTALEALEGMMV